MTIKKKFHLTLVVLISLSQILFGPLNTAKAKIVDKLNFVSYNLAKGAGGNIYTNIFNILNINNINNVNIKFISLKLTNVTLFNQTHKQQLNINSVLNHTDEVEILMYAIKTIETHGRYKAKSQWSDACGAYQYMPITWNNYKGFKNACLAPEWVQDSKMRGEINWAWKRYHNWQQVIASHYLPSYANQEKLWNIHFFKGQPTIRQYVQNVEQTMNSVEAGLATA